MNALAVSQPVGGKRNDLSAPVSVAILREREREKERKTERKKKRKRGERKKEKECESAGKGRPAVGGACSYKNCGRRRQPDGKKPACQKRWSNGTPPGRPFASRGAGAHTLPAGQRTPCSPPGRIQRTARRATPLAVPACALRFSAYAHGRAAGSTGRAGPRVFSSIGSATGQSWTAGSPILFYRNAGLYSTHSAPRPGPRQSPRRLPA